MGNWEIPQYIHSVSDNVRGVTTPENFEGTALRRIILKRFSQEQLPLSFDSLLGLFVGDADVEKAIASGNFSENLLLIPGAQISLVDIRAPTISDDLSKRFNVDIIPENAFEFLAQSGNRYQLVTIMGADGVFDDSDVGKYRRKFLNHFLPSFVEKNGLVISMFRGGNSLLSGFGWKALHERDDFAGVWRKN